MTFSTFSRISAFSGELDAPDASSFSKPCFIDCVDREGGGRIREECAFLSSP